MHLLAEVLRCRPKEASGRCMNCKRWFGHTKKGMAVDVRNSKSKACVYIPISLQEKV
jgi:hypothetical protein